MELIAHRGDSWRYTENTMPAFMSAIKTGIKHIETDVSLTLDKVPVLFHDNDLQRICLSPLEVSKITYEQFKEIYPELLTVKEVNTLLKVYKDIRFNLDVKGGIEVLDRSLDLIDKNLYNRLLISSMETETIEEAKKDFEIALIIGYRNYRHIISYDRIHIPYNMLKFSNIFLRSKTVYVFTVNDKEKVDELSKIPYIKGVFSDNIDLFL